MPQDRKASSVYARHLGARISPKKVAPVADLVRGKEVHDAKVILTFDPTKASKLLLKILKSAEANARHNNQLTQGLYVSEVWVGPGPTLKRGRIASKSRFSPIFKRTANIYVGLKQADQPVAQAKKVSKAVKAAPKKKIVKKEKN